MGQPNKNEIGPAETVDAKCQRFQQQLNGCLDGRGSVSALAADPHLRGCCDCQIAFEVYQQFDNAGGAVLNGGARTFAPAGIRPTGKRPAANHDRRWLPRTTVAMMATLAAALMIYAVTSPANEQLNYALAADDASTSLMTETFVAIEAGPLASSEDGLLPVRVVEPLREAGTISQRWLSNRLGPVVAGGRGWERPWQYTSELPGIRPFHRSMNVALVFYNDAMTLL
jgi:hypothetical protein